MCVCVCGGVEVDKRDVYPLSANDKPDGCVAARGVAILAQIPLFQQSPAREERGGRKGDETTSDHNTFLYF